VGVDVGGIRVSVAVGDDVGEGVVVAVDVGVNTGGSLACVTTDLLRIIRIATSKNESAGNKY